MALAHAVKVPSHIDAETGIPKIELRVTMLEGGVVHAVLGIDDKIRAARSITPGACTVACEARDKAIVAGSVRGAVFVIKRVQCHIARIENICGADGKWSACVRCPRTAVLAVLKFGVAASRCTIRA